MATGFLKSLAVFTREIILHPTNTGAVCPSGPRLGKRMASYIPKDYRGTVVELGPGTGSITQEILARGVPPANLISVEWSPKLVAYLKQRFPELNPVQGDASELGNILKERIGDEFDNIDYIVSSLPFRSIPDEACRQITDQIFQTLSETGRFIQFTYYLASKPYIHFQRFRLLHRSIVWANMPPAKVDVYETKKG